MERIFVVTAKYPLNNVDMLKVNEFLKENTHYTVKNIVPIAQHDGSGCYGAIITVGEK